MKTIKGDLILKENTIIDGDLKVEGDIRCEGRNWDLKCWNLDCRNLDCGNLNCLNLNCENLNCWDLDCGNLNCLNLNFHAIAIAYKSFKCKSWKTKRKNYVIKCLDGKIEIKDEKKYCDKCGAELKNDR